MDMNLLEIVGIFILLRKCEKELDARMRKLMNKIEKELFNKRSIDDYRSFIKDPMAYQDKWELTPVDRGGTE